MPAETDPPLMNENGTYNITKANGSLCPDKTAEYIALMLEAGVEKITIVGDDDRTYVVKKPLDLTTLRALRKFAAVECDEAETNSRADLWNEVVIWLDKLIGENL
jgi:hypothetical protein